MPSTVPQPEDRTQQFISSPAPPTSGAKTEDGQDLMSIWAHKYRGATVEDLDPPPALSVNPSTPISGALMSAYERDYTHLTVIGGEDRALLGYLSMPRLRELLAAGDVAEADPVAKAMQRFRRRKGIYRTITMETPLEELEDFFRRPPLPSADGGGGGGDEGGRDRDFAVVTDPGRRFVLGVATRSDLEEFVKRRPG